MLAGPARRRLAGWPVPDPGRPYNPVMTHHRALQKESLTLPGPAGVIEALLEGPDLDTPRALPPAIAVICHPHPLHQGTMLNKVVQTLCRTMNELGMPALRFNFRGVGASEGEYDGGIGETADALAVCGWARAHYPGAALWLGGFSFGAMVACRAAVDARPAQLIAVAPPAARTKELLAGERPGLPWILVQGEADEVVSPAELKAWVAELSPAPDLLLLPGVDHFFHGRLTLLRDALLQRLSTVPAEA